MEELVTKLKEIYAYYWPGYYNDVQSCCGNCGSCIARKTAPPHYQAPLQLVLVGYPMEMVAVDIMAPFPRNQNGKCYNLVAEDNCTKWLEAWAISNQVAKTVTQKLLEEMFLHFSLPDRLHSDQGGNLSVSLLKSCASCCRLRRHLLHHIIHKKMVW